MWSIVVYTMVIMLSLCITIAYRACRQWVIDDIEHMEGHNTISDILESMEEGKRGGLVCIKHLFQSAGDFPLIFTFIKQQYENNATPTRVLFNYNVEKPLRSLLQPLGAI